MCGIFGWISSASNRIDFPLDVVQKSLATMKSRGPDDNGFMYRTTSEVWKSDDDTNLDKCSVMLAHVRLSIIDLSAAGKQPMVTKNSRYRISFNGEVYNYRELRKTLETLGFVFHTDTDTEVVLQAFAHWGTDCLNMFTGMFAMAIHDELESKLYLIRDHFGIKPLFYTYNKGNTLFFASELPVILGFPDVSHSISTQRAYDYLMFSDYDSKEETMVEGIYNLLPGHYLVVDTIQSKIIEKKRYWNLNVDSDSPLKYTDAAEKLREMFLDSIKLHLRSDVPFGTALSGGIDSSAITCAIRHVEPDIEFPSFSYIASGSSVNEEKWADIVSTHSRSTSHKVRVAAEEIIQDLDKLIQLQGEPFGGTSIYAQLRVFGIAKEAGIKVTLDGQGADEMLAGYIGYPGERIKTLLLHGNVVGAWKFFSATTQWPDRTKLDVFKRIVSVFSPKSLYPFLRSIGKGTLSPDWIDKNWLRYSKINCDIPRVEKIYTSKNYVRNELAKQLTQQGLTSLLRHGDRNSMHHSIESRVPFLTREMAEFMMSLPEEYLIASDGTTKAIFREAMRGIVPDKILNRRDKVGFATPENNWLRLLSPWVEKQLHDAKDLPIFDVAELKKEWQEILAGRKNFDARVWRWLNLIRWAKLFNLQFA